MARGGHGRAESDDQQTVDWSDLVACYQLHCRYALRQVFARRVSLMCLNTSIECATAMNVSVKDQLTLSVSVAIGSTIVSHSIKNPWMQ